MKITEVDAYQVFDSRGNPTIEAVVTLEDGSVGRGTVPSGASTGSHEALELRDGDPARFRGKSVYQAVANVKQRIRPVLFSLAEPTQRTLDQQLIDLDGSYNKSTLGANTMLSVSMAFCCAEANSHGIPLFEHLGDGRGNVMLCVRSGGQREDPAGDLHQSRAIHGFSSGQWETRDSDPRGHVRQGAETLFPGFQVVPA